MGVRKNEKKLKNSIKSAIKILDEQAHRLETQRKIFYENGKQAKLKGNEEEYDIAVSGLGFAIEQQKRVYSARLNFELALKLNDLYKMSVEFMDEMSSLAEYMQKLTEEEKFASAVELFKNAKQNADDLFHRSEDFLNEFNAELVKRKARDE